MASVDVSALIAQIYRKTQTEDQICGIAQSQVFQLNFDTSQMTLTIQVKNRWLKQIQIWLAKHVVCVVQTL